jgi:hypothetical protein
MLSAACLIHPLFPLSLSEETWKTGGFFFQKRSSQFSALTRARPLSASLASDDQDLEQLTRGVTHMTSDGMTTPGLGCQITKPAGKSN